MIDGINAASQLTWRWEDILACSAGSVSSQKSFKWRKGQERESKGCDLGKTHLAIAGFEDGREPGAKECWPRNWKKEKALESSLKFLERNTVQLTP